MWYDRGASYLLDSGYIKNVSFKQNYTVRKGSYERLINHYYGKDSLFKRTLPHAGNYKLLSLNERTKDVEMSLRDLMENPNETREDLEDDWMEAYNRLIKAFDSTDNAGFASRKMWLTSVVNAYSSELEKAGYFMGEDGTLVKKAVNEESEEVTKNRAALFQGEDSFGKHLLDRTLKVGYEALTSLCKTPKLYRANGSFIYTIQTGTLFNDAF